MCEAGRPVEEAHDSALPTPNRHHAYSARRSSRWWARMACSKTRHGPVLWRPRGLLRPSPFPAVLRPSPLAAASASSPARSRPHAQGPAERPGGWAGCRVESGARHCVRATRFARGKCSMTRTHPLGRARRTVRVLVPAAFAAPTTLASGPAPSRHRSICASCSTLRRTRTVASGHLRQPRSGCQRLQVDTFAIQDGVCASR